ncbi:hypothetical protein J2X76_003274 [Neorhizobium sp. 2083]|uniref:hypothetical protein n=1 Tax=Neorhizobium sp. 2083 TaxID=2817762 RepID=UPI002865E2AB|nr:hypothetical protein [Neorhizobium sp. 2083]MDR6818097.1 hypothetical protein [Neorhizobium sp. 2083]
MINTDQLRFHLARGLPSPRLRATPANYPHREVKTIILCGRHPNPTMDYYFTARLMAPGMPPHHILDIDAPNFDNLDPNGAFVIVCRYASPSVLSWIESSAEQLAGLGLFLDDDISAVIASRESSLSYKASLLARGILPLFRLNGRLDIIWASTPSLAQSLRYASARILPPAPPKHLWDVLKEDGMTERDPKRILMGYHASGIHIQEHFFLQPIIQDVLTLRPDVRFEVFTDKKTEHLWREMDRVQIRRQLPWKAYLDESAARRIDIMLVPLSPSHINNCRAPTKRVDVARLGAAGIFSVSEAYGDQDESGEIRIAYNADVWRETILLLVDDPCRRSNAAAATRTLVEQMSQEAEAGLRFW